MTQAVHLETVSDMTMVSFIRALKRFSARRGFPKRILSDNAKTFKAAAKFLIAIFENPDVKTYLANCRIEWVFNLEKAPWWGGLLDW